MKIDIHSETPIYRQICNQIELQILSGAWAPGMRIPTVREMALQIRVNPNTVAKSYQELRNAGILVNRTGDGCYVAEPKDALGAERRRKLEAAAADYLAFCRSLGAADAEITGILASLLNRGELEK